MIGAPPLDERLLAALAEDLGEAGDVTSNAVFPADHNSSAVIIAKQDAIVCGGGIVERLFCLHDSSVSVTLLAQDGARVAHGDRVVELRGATRSILAVERTALNLLQRLSGIATQTRRFVDAAAGRAAICDTRKTTPLWRDLEKHAVACGGGVNHRMGLHDMVMLKDTHADGAGGLEAALRAVAPLRPRLKVAAEARDLDEVRAALAAGVDLLMLDNMPRAMVAEAAALARGKATTEITGGVTLDSVGELAALGVDRVSVGALTHSVPAVDFSLRIDLAAR